jgi:ribosomal subunit interface protein
MEITISHRNVEIPRDLRQAVDIKVGHLNRYLDMLERAEVRFAEQPHKRVEEREICEVTLVGQKGTVVRARSTAGDAMAALDTVMDKLVRQLERRKARVRQGHPHHRVVIAH